MTGWPFTLALLLGRPLPPLPLVRGRRCRPLGPPPTDADPYAAQWEAEQAQRAALLSEQSQEPARAAPALAFQPGGIKKTTTHSPERHTPTMTQDDFLTQRAAAGAAYAAAAAAYLQAWIDLRAFDLAGSNGNVRALQPGVGGSAMPEIVGHAEFLTGQALTVLSRDPAGQAMAKSLPLIKSLT